MSERVICGVLSYSGPNREPLGCGYKKGHDGGHSWGTLPTFPQNTEFDQEILNYVAITEPDAWTSILNLCREHYGDVHFQSINYCQAMRYYAEKLG